MIMLNNAKVLVVGDIILDRYIWGSIERVSPEAPVPILDVKKKTSVLGGAANVANNLLALGAAPILCGVIDGSDGLEVQDLMTLVGLTCKGLHFDVNRRTTVKTRIMCGEHQTLRIDEETREPISSGTVLNIIRFFDKIIEDIDIIVLSDYNKGVLTKGLVDHIIEKAWEREVKVIVDPKPMNMGMFRRSYLMAPNLKELEAFCNHHIKDDIDLADSARIAKTMCGCSNIIITLGAEGMLVVDSDNDGIHIHTTAKEVYDVCGAGDTVMAALAIGIASGMPVYEAAKLATIAAGIAVSKVGTAVVTRKELEEAHNGRR